MEITGGVVVLAVGPTAVTVTLGEKTAFVKATGKVTATPDVPLPHWINKPPPAGVPGINEQPLPDIVGTLAFTVVN